MCINSIWRGKWHNHLCDLVHCSPVESVSAQSCLLASVSPSPPVVSLEVRCMLGPLERPAVVLLRRSLPVWLHKRKDIKILYLVDMVHWALSSVFKDGCDYFYVRDCEISSDYLHHDRHFIKCNKVLTTMSYYCMSRKCVFCSVLVIIQLILVLQFYTKKPIKSWPSRQEAVGNPDDVS